MSSDGTSVLLAGGYGETTVAPPSVATVGVLQPLPVATPDHGYRGGW
jgi:hypothetical protein